MLNLRALKARLFYTLSCLHPMDHSMKTFHRQYSLQERIGSGGFGVVYNGVRLSDNKLVAIKFVAHGNVREWAVVDGGGLILPSEIVYLQLCKDIDGVVKLVGWFGGPKGFFLVMERLENNCMDLFDVISKHGYLHESTARFMLVQLVSALIAMHQRHSLVHMDIKDENVVVGVETGSVVLIDFGAVERVEKVKKKAFRGTKSFAPPEWLKQKDILTPLEGSVYSLGVLLYVMVVGVMPFKSEGQLKLPNRLSTDCRDFIQRCLKQCPQNRPPLEDLLQHPWLKGGSMNIRPRSINRQRRVAMGGCATDISGYSSTEFATTEEEKDETYRDGLNGEIMPLSIPPPPLVIHPTDSFYSTARSEFSLVDEVVEVAECNPMEIYFSAREMYSSVSASSAAPSLITSDGDGDEDEPTVLLALPPSRWREQQMCSSSSNSDIVTICERPIQAVPSPPLQQLLKSSTLSPMSVRRRIRRKRKGKRRRSKSESTKYGVFTHSSTSSLESLF